MLLLKNFYHWILPPTCVLCGLPSFTDQDLCITCYRLLPWIKNPCIQCGEPIKNLEAIHSRCGSCLAHPPPFDNTIALFTYETPVNHLITQLKFQKKLVYARLLGELLTQHLQSLKIELPNFIIPVPLHPKRARLRGFNQALEIARYISHRLLIPIDKKNCKRIKNTLPQSSIPADQRYKNIKNAFVITQDFQADHVAIIDDVVTTTQTVTALSKILRQAGVKKISIWCCARTHLF